MTPRSTKTTKDLQVLKLLTKLANDTDRLIRLADDIDTHATSPQSEDAFNIIGREVEKLLASIDDNLAPLYELYELDAGLRRLAQSRQTAESKFELED